MSVQERDEEELLRLGREALKREQFVQAREFLAEYCERLSKRGTPLPPGVLASYALALGNTRGLKEAVELCLRALELDRRNPHVYWSLAQLYMLGDSKKRAIEAIADGLRFSPDHRGLLALRDGLGVRRPPPVPFLPRNSGLNVRLGKAIHKLKGSPKPPSRTGS